LLEQRSNKGLYLLVINAHSIGSHAAGDKLAVHESPGKEVAQSGGLIAGISKDVEKNGGRSNPAQPVDVLLFGLGETRLEVKDVPLAYHNP